MGPTADQRDPQITVANGVLMTFIPSLSTCTTKQKTGSDPSFSTKHYMGWLQPQKQGWIRPTPHGPQTKHMLSSQVDIVCAFD